MIPPSLDAAIAQCLAPVPDRRYARAGDLAEDLRRFLDNRPENVHAPEPSIRERAKIGPVIGTHGEQRGSGVAFQVIT